MGQFGSIEHHHQQQKHLCTIIFPLNNLISALDHSFSWDDTSTGDRMNELKMARDVTIELHAGRKSTEGRLLGLELIKFAEVIEEGVLAVRPSVLCRYLYDLSLIFRRYYEVQVEAEVKKTDSILLLCEATVMVMEKCFDLLGIRPAEKLERFYD